jgi:hypothetical protein
LFPLQWKFLLSCSYRSSNQASTHSGVNAASSHWAFQVYHTDWLNDTLHEAAAEEEKEDEDAVIFAGSPKDTGRRRPWPSSLLLL